ncbi:MAG: hypothetical protein HY923_01955 [Elusimicrobia bacterium]|nr:hypothetical protein [Elusimicrobiota bacterium]
MIEMMLVVAILGVIFAVGPRLFTGIFQFYTQSTARTEVQRELRAMLENMNRTIRQASADTVSISQDTGQPPYSKISFTTIDGRSVTYKQSGRSLIQVVGNGSTTLSKNISYVAFTYPQTDTRTVMAISVTLEKATYSGRTAALQMAITKVRVMNP